MRRPMTRTRTKLFGRSGKTTRPNRPGRSSRPALEQLEAREVPIVGAFAIPPIVPPGAGLDGVVKLFTSSGEVGTGTLLADGRHILTAAHVVTEDDGHVDPAASTQVVFTLPGGNVTFDVPAANYRIHPGWEGGSSVFIPDDDLAILELPSLARIGAERHAIYRGRDEVGRTFRMVGYGRTGTGNEGATIIDGQKRQGLNRFDTAADGKLEFIFSGFDPNETFVAKGDSGGPDLLGGRIAGVHSAVRETFAATVLLSGEPESQFGERAFSTRVSSYAGWIDEQTRGTPLVLDMSFQPDGNDGLRDKIDVRVIGGDLQIRVNGRLYHSETATNVGRLTILGSNDSEDFVIEGRLPVDVSISGRGSSELLPQSLTVLGTIGPDAVTVGPGTVTLGGHTISHTLDLTVNTLGGNDAITVAGA